MTDRKQSRETSFAGGLKNHDAEAIRSAPKGDYHIHSTLSASVCSTSRVLGIDIPPATRRYDGLQPFFEYYDVHVKPYLQTTTSIEKVIAAGIDDAIADGVREIEMSFDLKHIGHYTIDEDGNRHGHHRCEHKYFDYIETLIAAYADRIDIRPEIGISRPFDPSSNLSKHAFPAYLESKLFSSIDTYGAEDEASLHDLKPLYRRARKKGLKLKAHAGEFGSAATVLEAVKTLDLDEVQHGIGAATSQKALKEIRARNIRLNVCPTSNIVLGAAMDIAAHPIRTLVDFGIRVSINTDDPLVFHTTVSNEYVALYDAGLFSADELDELRQTNLTTASLS